MVPKWDHIIYEPGRRDYTEAFIEFLSLKLSRKRKKERKKERRKERKKKERK